MGNPINNEGLRYGKLVALKKTDKKTPSGSIFWECVCDCGNYILASTSALRSKNTRSCGCLQKEAAKKLKKTHGMYNTRTYTTWAGIKRRCLNTNYSSYINYGGRGISICNEWLTFSGFYKDMGDRPEGMSIDRKDNDKGYFKENCRWVTKDIQQQNTRLLRKTNKSGYRGVFLDKRSGKWLATIHAKGRYHWLGLFVDIIAAAKKRDSYIIENNLSHTLNFGKGNVI